MIQHKILKDTHLQTNCLSKMYLQKSLLLTLQLKQAF